MDEKRRVKVSKFLSLILRHAPEAAGVALEDDGWVDVGTLLSGMAKHGTNLSREELAEIVATSDKQRFAFSEDGLKIRANQGHSVVVEIRFEARVPPATLFHGTATRFIASIREKGLLKMNRQYVHLSTDEETMRKVGMRHGVPVLLRIKAGAMHAARIPFYLSANNVWMTEFVAPEFIEFPE